MLPQRFGASQGAPKSKDQGAGQPKKLNRCTCQAEKSALWWGTMPVFKVVAANAPLIFPPQSLQLIQGFLSLCTTTEGNQKTARTRCKNKDWLFFLLFLKKMRKTLGHQFILFPYRATPPCFSQRLPPPLQLAFISEVFYLYRQNSSHSSVRNIPLHWPFGQR